MNSSFFPGSGSDPFCILLSFVLLFSVLSGCTGGSGDGGGDTPFTLEVEYVDAAAGEGVAHITWRLVTGEEFLGYKVYREESGSGKGFEVIAIVSKDTYGYSETGLTIGSSYTYGITCMTAGFAEGPLVEAGAVTSVANDTSVPKPPGHEAGSVLTAAPPTASGVALQWDNPAENTDGSVIQSGAGIAGAVVFKSNNLTGKWTPIHIAAYTSGPYTFTDYYGTVDDFYYVSALDTTGNLSAPSNIASPDAAVVIPGLVQDVNAFAAAAVGDITVTWTLDADADVGYRVFRSAQPDKGFEDISGVVSAAVNTYTDSSASLEQTKTYWYKVAGISSDGEGTPSVADSAVPGPSGDVYYLEAENAMIASVSSSADWTKLDRVSKHAPFKSGGALEVEPSGSAIAGVSFVTLQWSVEIDSSGPAGSVETYAVYLSCYKDNLSGIMDLFIQEPVSGSNVINLSSVDFYESQFGTPEKTYLINLGNLNFVDEDFVGGNPTRETINMRLGYQGKNASVPSGMGNLIFDALILVKQ